MKNIKLHIAILVFSLACLSNAFAQGVSLNNTGGKLENRGTIRVKAGQVKNLPDTLNGRIEFSSQCESHTQEVPNIVYEQLVLQGKGLKETDSVLKNRTLTVKDSLVVRDSARVKLYKERIVAKSAVYNNATTFGNKEIRLKGDTTQEIIGNGAYDYLTIDNPKGVKVKGGGFTVNKELNLSAGELSNNSTENFNLADSTKIVRYSGSSLANSPNFAKTVNVEYRGDSEINAGPEIPDNPTTLQNLIANNNSSLNLTKKTTVNDSLFVRKYIDTKKDTLVLNTGKNPVFNQTSEIAQIAGTIRLIKVRFDSTRNYLHNPFTYAVFGKPNPGLKELIVDVRPRTFFPYPGGNVKAKRTFAINAIDSNGASMTKTNDMVFGYGWRVLPGDTLDESNGLVTNQLVFQRFDNGAWTDNVFSNVARDSNQIGWAFSSTSNLSDFGYYVIGHSGGILAFNAKVFLEGPFRYGSMADDLKNKGYLTMPPPDIYPYNMDPNRKFYVTQQLPDSVVDWVVVEFRANFTEPGKVRTYLVKRNGKLCDIYGNEELLITGTGNDSNRIDSGNYYIVVRHRNHLAIVTDSYISLLPGIKREMDFSVASFVKAGAGSLKKLGKNDDGSLIWGMIAGDINRRSESQGINDADFDEIIPQLNLWSQGAFEGYLNGDIDMNGIITTKDYNKSFNNRDRTSPVVDK